MQQPVHKYFLPGFPCLMMRRYSFILSFLFLFPVFGCSLFFGDTTLLIRRKAMDHFGQGEILEKQGNYSLAIEEFLKSEKLSSRPAVYYHLGHCYLKLQNPERAIDFFQRAISLSPDYKQAKIELALAEKEFKKSRSITSLNDTGDKVLPSATSLETLPYNEDTSDTSLLKKGKTGRQPLPLFFFRIGENKKDGAIDTASLPTMNEVNKLLFPDSYKEEKSREKESAALQQYIDRKKKSQDSFSFHIDKARVYRESKLYDTAALEYTDALRDNPQVLQLRAIEKWSGILPIYMGGSGPLPFLDVTK